MRKLMAIIFIVSITMPVSGGENYRQIRQGQENWLVGPFNHTRKNYVIRNAQQLARLSDIPGDYVLANDIILPDDWTPIKTFIGQLNGRGYTVVATSTVLFDTVENAAIKNLSVIGGFANIIKNSTVERCYAMDGFAKTQNGEAGGFVGLAIDSYFAQCYVRQPTVTADNAGGFAGRAVSSIFVECGVEGGMVNGSRTAGGFIGVAEGKKLSSNAKHTMVFKDSFAGSVVNGSQINGGFAGELSYSRAENCAAIASVYGVGEGILFSGGFVGRMSGHSRIINTRAAGDVLVEAGEAGGFVGTVTGGSCVEYSYSMGNILGKNTAGGFVGRISGDNKHNTISYCLSLANYVVGSEYTNRFAGRMEHEGVDNCYAYFGCAVLSDGVVKGVTPGLYTNDAADTHMQNLPIKTVMRYNTERIDLKINKNDG